MIDNNKKKDNDNKDNNNEDKNNKDNDNNDNNNEEFLFTSRGPIHNLCSCFCHLYGLTIMYPSFCL